MVIQEIENSKVNKVKVHCGECSKTLWLEDYGLEDFVPGIIDLMESRAIQHVNRHPKHHPTVMIYKRLPTNKELRES